MQNSVLKNMHRVRDIGKNVSNFAGLVWKANFVHFFANTLGLAAYFLNPIFALKPWVQAGRFEYHEPYNPKKKFTYKGVKAILLAMTAL